MRGPAYLIVAEQRFFFPLVPGVVVRGQLFDWSWRGLPAGSGCFNSVVRSLRIAPKESKRGQTPLRDPPLALPSAGLFYCFLPKQQKKAGPNAVEPAARSCWKRCLGPWDPGVGLLAPGAPIGRCNGVPTDLTHPLSVTSDSVSPQIQCRVRRRAHGSVETVGAGTGRQLATGPAQVACRPWGRLRVDETRLIALRCHGNRYSHL